MQTKATDRCSRRHPYRALMAIAALVFSGVAGAGTTIKTIVAYEHRQMNTKGDGGN